MRTQSITQEIINQFKNYKIARHEKMIDKYFKIKDTSLPYDSYEKMYTARETIANYAKHNGVSIEINDARNELGEFDSPIFENIMSGKINIVVKNLKNKLVQRKIISAINDNDPRKVYHEITKKIMVNIPEDGTQRIAETKSYSEETFLRNLYRHISEMTNNIKEQ